MSAEIPDEIKKVDILDRIDYLKEQKNLIELPNKEYIYRHFEKDMNIKEKSEDEQKRIIQTYVKKVIVYDDSVDVSSQVDMTDGAEGNRTPVRKPIHYNFSHYSQFIDIPLDSRQLTGLNP